MHSQHAPGDGMGVWIFTFPQVYSPILFLLILSEVWICFFISSECVRDLGSWHQNCKVNQEFVCSSSMDLLYFLSAVGSSWVHFGTGLCIFFFHFWMLAYESKILILHIVFIVVLVYLFNLKFAALTGLKNKILFLLNPLQVYIY